MNVEIWKQYIAYFCVHIIKDVWDSVGGAAQTQTEAISMQTVPSEWQWQTCHTLFYKCIPFFQHRNPFLHLLPQKSVTLCKTKIKTECKWNVFTDNGPEVHLSPCSNILYTVIDTCLWTTVQHGPHCFCLSLNSTALRTKACLVLMVPKWTGLPVERAKQVFRLLLLSQLLWKLPSKSE